MHELPRQKLCELLAKHGPSLCDDVKTLEGLLKDVLRNDHKRETVVLISALREGVAHELRGSTSGMPLAALAAKLVRQLYDNLALDEAAAQWSVESWAIALGLQISDGQSQFSIASPSVATQGVDLAAIVQQHRDKAQQDQVAKLDASIKDAVQNGRLRFLRGRVEALLKLQPTRSDLLRLLDVLPEDPELPRAFTNSIGMRFVLIERGEFMMGSNVGCVETPPHLVRITKPFYLGVFSVTQVEYRALTGLNPSHFTGNPQLPVEGVSWHDAVACCEKLSELPVEAQRGASYRLPTEAEWEYSCRAGSTGKWCFGDNESSLGEYAWFYNNSGCRTHRVGEKQANSWGLHDMHGNVWEWCQDGYDAEAYDAQVGIAEDPFVESGAFRVNRGGSSCCFPHLVRSANRSGSTPDHGNSFLGFRLARNIVE